jgi:hypothetical protein
MGEFIKDIVAITNGNIHQSNQIGYLLFGVNDNGDIAGYDTMDLEFNPNDRTDRRLLLDKIDSYIEPNIEGIQFIEQELNGKKLCAIVIPPSPYLHKLKKKLNADTIYSEQSVLIRRSDGENTYVAPDDVKEILKKEKLNRQIIIDSRVKPKFLFSLSNMKFIFEEESDPIAILEEIAFDKLTNYKEDIVLSFAEEDIIAQLKEDIKSSSPQKRLDAKKILKHLEDLESEISIKLIVLSRIVKSSYLYPESKNISIIFDEITNDLYSYRLLIEETDFAELINTNVEFRNSIRIDGDVSYDVGPKKETNFRYFKISLDEDEIEMLRKSSLAKFNTLEEFIENSLIYLGLEIGSLPKNTIFYKVIPGAVDRIYDLVIDNKLNIEEFHRWNVTDWKIGLG